MANDRIFGTNITPQCRYCEHTMQITSDETTLCERKGVVAANSKCRNYVYDPLKRIPQKPLIIEKIAASEFEL